MARKSKDMIIEELEQSLKIREDALLQLSKENSELIQAADDAFSISSYRYQLEEQVRYYKNIAYTTSSLLEITKRNYNQMSDTVHQLYEDNEALTKAAGGQYFIGITEESITDTERDRLREQINQLKASLETKEAKIEQMQEEILRLHTLVGNLKAKLSE